MCLSSETKFSGTPKMSRGWAVWILPMRIWPNFGHFSEIADFWAYLRLLWDPNSSKWRNWRREFMGEVLLMLYSNFHFKKTPLKTCMKPKTVKKFEIFSIFRNFGGQLWGHWGLWGHVPPKFKTKYMNSFLVVFVTLTYLVFEKLLQEVCFYIPQILDVWNTPQCISARTTMR